MTWSLQSVTSPKRCLGDVFIIRNLGRGLGIIRKKTKNKTKQETCGLGYIHGIFILY